MRVLQVSGPDDRLDMRQMRRGDAKTTGNHDDDRQGTAREAGRQEQFPVEGVPLSAARLNTW
jgi:hypothetical protein